MKQCLQTHTSKSENKKGKQTRRSMLGSIILKLRSQGWKISVRSKLLRAVQQVSSQSELFIVRPCLQHNKTTRSSKLCLLSQRSFPFKELLLGGQEIWHRSSGLLWKLQDQSSYPQNPHRSIVDVCLQSKCYQSELRSRHMGLQLVWLM